MGRGFGKLGHRGKRFGFRLGLGCWLGLGFLQSLRLYLWLMNPLSSPQNKIKIKHTTVQI